MSDNRHFITDIERFREMQVLIGNVFHTTRELPDQVFHRNYSRFVFEQFDLVMEPQFWVTLQKLAEKTHEDFILLGVLKPDPVDYFYREFNCFNWIELPIHLTEDEYWERLEAGPADSPTDAILYNSSTVVWVPPSKQWAVWGDRNPEICVMGFKEGVFDAQSGVDNWKKVNDQAVKNWISLSCRNEEVVDVFLRDLTANYSR